MRRLLLLLLCLVAPGVWAAGWNSRTVPTITQTSANRVTITPGATAGSVSEMDRLMNMPARFAEATSEGGALLKDIFKRNPYLKPSIDIQAERVVTARAIAKAAFRAMPLISAAMAAQELLDAAGCKFSQETGMTCTGTTHEETTTGQYVYKVLDCSSCAWYLSAWEAAAAHGRMVEAANNQNPDNKFKMQVTGCDDYGTQNVTVCHATQTGSNYRLVNGVWTWVTVSPSYYHWQVGRSTSAQTVQKCDFELVNGVCVQVPNEDQWADRADKPGVWPKLPPIIPDLDKVPGPGGIFDTSPPTIKGPPAVDGGRNEDRQNPDGSRTTVDRDWRVKYSPGPQLEPWYEVEPQDTTVTWPPGTTPNPYKGPDPVTGNPNPANTTTTPGSGGSPPTVVVQPGTTNNTTIINNSNTTTVDVHTCGLPGKPPCKIDESGTPTADTHNPEAEAQGIFAAAKACILTPSSCVPSLPSLNWGFELPSHCSVIPTPAFEPAITGIDICRFQPMFHDIMSLVWAAAGLFAAVQMVFRDATGS